MRPIPHPDDQTDDGPVDAIIEKAFEILHKDGGVHDCEEAVQDAIRLLESASRHHAEDAVERMHEELPDEFECHIGQDENNEPKLVVETDCPECGHGTIFNGMVEMPTQWVRSETDDDGNGHCIADDGQYRLQRVSCGNCHSEIFRADKS